MAKDVLAEAVGELLRQRSFTLSLAESCTGGLLAHRVTNVPGSSVYFLGGVVAYSNAAKEQLLGVSHETLERCGAVSQETALEMARGARRVFDSHLALSITGIAGPTGGSPEKPVGLTFICLAAPEGEWVERHIWKGDREANKGASAKAALDLLQRYLHGELREGRSTASRGHGFVTTRVDARVDSEGRISPVAFTWRGERLEVRDVGRRWQEGPEECCLVMTPSDAVFELRFDPDEGRWRARQISAPQALV
jgi:PncC family amidohydrolase